MGEQYVSPLLPAVPERPVSDSGGRIWRTLAVATVAVGLIGGLELLTNSLDIQKFSWDFRYYIDMARQGFAAPLASPLAYRYLTPLLVSGISAVFALPVEGGFTAVAYVGAFTQLVSVFLFARWFTGSVKGAWVAMLVIAFSLFHVKFLLFDVFRPDHLAYPLIVLQSYFALKRRFIPLLVTTVVGTQIREFNAIPLLAYLFALAISPENGSASGQRRALFVQVLISAATLGSALAIPRLLIPVVEDFQFVSFSRDGILRPLLAPLILARDANFVYSIVAYLLPVLMLGGRRQLRAVVGAIQAPERAYLLGYSALVLVFSFLGGTDFYRFSTYLLVPQAILVGLLAERYGVLQITLVLLSIVVFNRIWLPFPMTSTEVSAPDGAR
jgi:hypothetical protein